MLPASYPKLNHWLLKKGSSFLATFFYWQVRTKKHLIYCQTFVNLMKIISILHGYVATIDLWEQKCQVRTALFKFTTLHVLANALLFAHNEAGWKHINTLIKLALWCCIFSRILVIWMNIICSELATVSRRMGSKIQFWLRFLCMNCSGYRAKI